MRVLVTGGAGFIGSHIVDAYVAAGHEVWVIDDLSRGKPENVNRAAGFRRMDLRSPELPGFLRQHRFDCINHHAAQIDVRVSVADPVRDATVNVLGSLNLLEAARVCKVPRLIFASTGGAIYGEQRQFPAAEEHPTAPLSPYGVAKLSVEHYLDYYRQVHGLHPVVLRYANVYGPRQDPAGEAGVVAIFCDRVLRQQRLIVYGDGEQTRDYVYVGDVARANLLALQCEPHGNRNNGKAASQSGDGGGLAFNISTGIETSVNALVATLFVAADADSALTYQPARPGEQRRSVIAPGRAERALGWRATTSLAEGLAKTLAWLRATSARDETLGMHQAADLVASKTTIDRN